MLLLEIKKQITSFSLQIHTQNHFIGKINKDEKSKKTINRTKKREVFFTSPASPYTPMHTSGFASPSTAVRCSV